MTIDLTVHLPSLLLGNGGVAPSISDTCLFCLCRLVRSRASVVVSLEVGMEEASKNLPHNTEGSQGPGRVFPLQVMKARGLTRISVMLSVFKVLILCSIWNHLH